MIVVIQKYLLDKMIAAQEARREPGICGYANAKGGTLHIGD